MKYGNQLIPPTFYSSVKDEDWDRIFGSKTKERSEKKCQKLKDMTKEETIIEAKR